MTFEKIGDKYARFKNRKYTKQFVKIKFQK